MSEAKFYTTNSELTIRNNRIWEKQLVETSRSYWFIVFCVLVIVTIYSIYEALYEDPSEWIQVIACIIWITPFLGKLYHLLFIKVWRWYIPLNEIREVQHNSAYNVLEEKVTIVLKSGRRKEYIFRKKEEEAKAFLEAFHSQPHIATWQLQ